MAPGSPVATRKPLTEGSVAPCPGTGRKTPPGAPDGYRFMEPGERVGGYSLFFDEELGRWLEPHFVADVVVTAESKWMYVIADVCPVYAFNP